ncbi:MAG: hypothetical protein J0L84_09890 [Verrucomicrobia bacterium]|nr:hypothetical protein [Verrucomicrobiota bacterium]
MTAPYTKIPICGLGFWRWVILGILGLAGDMLGDSEVCRMRAVRDPWVISVWTPAVVSSALPTGLRVMVQRRDTGAPVPDALVQLRLEPPAGVLIRPEEAYCGWPGDAGASTNSTAPGWPRTVAMRGGVSPADRTQAVRLRLPAAGDWNVTVSVSRGADRVSAATLLPVQAPLARLLAVWPSLLLPPVAILGYCLQQHWVRRRRP